ncbi:winged helix-turn-helix domain-containing protein [Enterococcus alishanensis]
MVRVLVLTKNIENELDLYRQLRNLGYEVFLSSGLLTDWTETKMLPSWTKGFSIVIFSETLIKNEVTQVTAYCKRQQQLCFLKLDTQWSEEKADFWQEQGIETCFSKGITTSELGELLNNVEISCSNGTFSEVVSVDKFQLQLSKVNKRLFSILLDEKGNNISRETLSRTLWGKSDPSTHSQLSYRVGKINQQIFTSLNIQPGIVTDWGKGYRLNEAFYELWMAI